MSTITMPETRIEAELPPRRRLQFAVNGVPAPQGSKSFKGMSRSGKAILTESSAAVRPWRQDVVAAAVNAIDDDQDFTVITGPVHLTVEFYLPRPKGHPKTKRTVPDTIPDLSKLVRSTEDALKTAGVWRDDAQVIDLSTRKRYSPLGDRAIGHGWEMRRIGALVTVEEIGADETWADSPLHEQSAWRFPRPSLPADLCRALVTPVAIAADWEEAIVITTTTSDSEARRLIAKARKLVRKRAGIPVLERTGRAALIVDGGIRRLSSTPGKPLTDVQSELIELLEETEAYDAGVDVVLAIETA